MSEHETNSNKYTYMLYSDLIVFDENHRLPIYRYYMCYQKCQIHNLQL